MAGALLRDKSLLFAKTVAGMMLPSSSGLRPGTRSALLTFRAFSSYSHSEGRPSFSPLCFWTPVTGSAVAVPVGALLRVCCFICCLQRGFLLTFQGRKGWLKTLGACMHAKSLQLCPTLFDPIDCSLPGSSVHGILQERILEWVALPSSRGSSRPRDSTHISYVFCTGRRILYH